MITRHDIGLAKIFKRQINRARYRRQYARRKPIERKVRLGIGPVVYNCPVKRWTRENFLSMWGGVRYMPIVLRVDGK